MSKNLEMKFYSNKSPKCGFTWETPPVPVSEAEIAETLEADVVIIGGGISGMSAAARCSAVGLSCIVIDKSERQIAIGAQFAAINTRTMAEKGIVIDKKQLAADWLKVSGSRVEEALLWIFINRSAEGFHWMLDLAGDCVEPRVYVSYKGPMFGEYLGTHHIDLKEGRTEYDAKLGGPLACEIFQKELLKNGGQLFRGVAATQLEKDADGRVVSCIAKGKDGKLRRYKGRKAVVLATGDCSDDKEMLEAFCPSGLRAAKHFPRNGNTGDGQKMAYWAGAVLDNPEWASTLHALGYSGFQFFYLHVNRLGKRFMNEDTWMQAKSIRCMMQPGGDFCFTLFDDKYADEIGERWDLLGGQGMSMLHFVGDKFNREELVTAVERVLAGRGYPADMPDSGREPHGWKADTLEALAEKMDVPYETLKATVDRYNELVTKGDDTDFGKRDEMLTPIIKPPFYALKWGATLLDVFGGALTDSRLNVLDSGGNPIPGLYAVGNVAGGMYAIDYPLLLNGNSYGRALAYCMQLADSLLEDNT
ncbi:MAG: FAD-binding protein [Oscillospiraceae bacterium]|nr:FAD-binding protein [Oscillospiraceae bacterium]